MALIRELNLTVRHLLRSPGYTLAALATLALAIGATTAIFSAVYAVLLRPLPIASPDRVVVGWGLDPGRFNGLVELTYRDVEALGRSSRSLSSIASVGASTWNAVLEETGDPVRLAYAGVSGGFFDTLGVRPLLGRVLTAEDDVPGAPGAIVLSHGAWVRRFGSDPAIVGRSVRLDGELQQIVGVMPEGFDYPRGAEFWAPLVPGLDAASAAWKTDVLENVGILFFVGRLREGVTARMAAEDLTSAALQIEKGRVAPRIGTQVVAQPFLDHVVGPARPAIWALFGAVAVLLLIACANVSGLMLTRVSAAHREHAIRVAIGATRGAIGRLWAMETTVLVVAGGLAGLLIAGWLTAAIVRLAPEGIPRLDEVAINLPVAGFAMLVMLATALLCGLGPARHATSLDLAATLNDGGRTMSGGGSVRARSALLVAEIGLAVVLLVGAGLLLRSFAELRNVDLGFDQSNILTLQVEPRVEQPPVNDWMRDLLARVAARPGVTAAGSVYLRPLSLGPIGQGTWVLLEGQPDTPEAAAANPVLNYQVATPGYFTAMRIPLRSGRTFTDADRAGTERVAIVSESTARRLWPGQDAVGQRLLTSSFDRSEGAPSKAWRTVVGVVSDVRYRGIDEVQLDLYDPAAQSPLGATDLVIRTSGDPVALAAAVQADARALDPGVLVNGITTLDAVVSRAIAPWRFSAWMLSLFALVAFALSMVGLFSLVSLDVARRQHEFAIRLALGATRSDIASRVFRSAVARGVVGLLCGLAAAGFAVRAIRSLLFGVPLFDWPTYAVVVLLVSAVVAAASYWPVRAAAAADPVGLLRHQA